MRKLTLIIPNKLGLHARAAAKLVTLASQFNSHIMVEYDQSEVNAKSIMGIMMLAASQGAEIILSCDGDDENEALLALQDLIEQRFGEAQ